jgi:hypothetical protein
MKAKDLIALLEKINPEDEVGTPGFDESGLALNFTLSPIWIVKDAHPATVSFAPHERVQISEREQADLSRFPGCEKVKGYLLNGVW